jgi:peptidoglycan/LPS O-acetylase OafA/YrhL
VVTVTGISLMVLAIKFSGPDGLLSRIISHLGKLTFPVYIVHEMCMFFLNHRGIKDIILSHTGDNGIGVFFYEAAYVLLIFVTASLISEVIIFIKNSVIIKTFKSIKKGER